MYGDATPIVVIRFQVCIFDILNTACMAPDTIIDRL